MQTLTTQAQSTITASATPKGINTDAYRASLREARVCPGIRNDKAVAFVKASLVRALTGKALPILTETEGKVKADSARGWAAICRERGLTPEQAMDQRRAALLSALSEKGLDGLTIESETRFSVILSKPLSEPVKTGKRGKPCTKAFFTFVWGRQEVIEARTWKAAQVAADSFQLMRSNDKGGRAWLRPFVMPLRDQDLTLALTYSGKAWAGKGYTERVTIRTRIAAELALEWRG